MSRGKYLAREGPGSRLHVVPVQIENSFLSGPFHQIKLLSFSIRQMWTDSWIRRKKHSAAPPGIELGSSDCRSDALTTEKELTVWWKTKIRTQFPSWLRSSAGAYTAQFEGCERTPLEKSTCVFFLFLLSPTEACFLTNESTANEFDRRSFATLELKLQPWSCRRTATAADGLGGVRVGSSISRTRSPKGVNLMHKA